MHEDSGLPDEVFTELEHSAGVPFLLRGDNDLLSSRKIPKTEIDSSIAKDELVALLTGSYCGNNSCRGVHTDVISRVGSDNLNIDLSVFDCHPSAPFPRFYLEIERNDRVSISFLIDVLRSTGLPLISSDQEWLAWDEQDNVLRWGIAPDQNPLGYFQGRSPEKKAIDEHELQLIRFMQRAGMSTDHGKKPLLIQNLFLEDAKQKRQVKFESPRRILSSDFKSYTLAFYDATGTPKFIPLAEVTKFGIPIFTRTTVYVSNDGDLFPVLSRAKLLASAFLIATKFNPNEFQWYRCRERGTIYHSALERINPRDDGYKFLFHQGSKYEHGFITTNSSNSLIIATEIVERASELGLTYITINGHPQDVDLVTTPEMYQRAIETLLSSGHKITYDLAPGVRIDNADLRPPERPKPRPTPR